MSPTPATGRAAAGHLLGHPRRVRIGRTSSTDDFDYDNSPFLDELRGRGFYVADHSTANYLKTALSIDLGAQPGVPRRHRPAGTGELRRRLGTALPWAVGRPSTWSSSSAARGYRFIYRAPSGARRPGTQRPRSTTSTTSSTSEFLDVLAGATMLRAFEGLGPRVPVRLAPQPMEPDPLRAALACNRASTLAGPKFIHAQFALTTSPYVFHADGSFVIAEEEAGSPAHEELRGADEVRQRTDAGLARPILDVPADQRPIGSSRPTRDRGPSATAANEVGFDWTEGQRRRSSSRSSGS